MPTTHRPVRRPLVAALAVLGLLLAACGSSAEPTVNQPANNDSVETNDEAEVAEPDAGGEISGDVGSAGGALERGSDDVDLSAEPNPAAGDIRELISAQASIYTWTPDQVECISNGVIATGEPTPGDVANDEYAQIIAGCGALRGQLEFALGIMLDRGVASCLVDALSDDEVNDLGIVVLEDTFEAAEAATNAALADHPECA